MFEHGNLLSLTARTSEVLMLRLKKSIHVYEDIENFAEDASKEKASAKVKLENVQKLFVYFGGFLVLVFLVFIVHVVLSKKKLKFFIRKLFRSLVDFLLEFSFSELTKRFISFNLWLKNKSHKKIWFKI